ncbi:MAG: histidine phosphatase family protein [Sphingorhabdus sp.]|nr:histidine phosphatase family protein [Sphingorhabdus sp.]
MTISTNGKRIFIARHGETVFNAVGRMQGMDAHTPLTREGCEQAVRMGEALRGHVADSAHAKDGLQLLASPSGRTLQTLALVAAEIGANWHDHETDVRLREIDVGEWEGQYYADLFPDLHDLMDMEHKLFKQYAVQGEDYVAVAARLRAWLADQAFERDMLIISHGMTARVLRGILLGLPDLAGYGAPIASSLSQGSMVAICDGAEQLIHSGDGSGEKA